MKLKLLALPLAAMVFNPALAANLDTDKKKISYAIGLQVGQDLQRNGLDVDTEALSAAIKDVIKGNKPQLNQQQMQEAMNKFREQQMKKQMAAATENKTKGEAFLAANKSKPGIKTTDSGIQYKVIKAGAGKSPTKANSVIAHYRGTLIDGTEFDSSFKRGQPATFPVTGVIKGWQEILPLMKTGAKWQVFIPSELAYGQRGTPTIGPNSALIFDIELLEIK